MMRRISLPVGLVLFLATNAWAQLGAGNMRQMQLGAKVIF